MADTETVPDKVQINVIRCKGLVTDMFKFPFLQNKSKIFCRINGWVLRHIQNPVKHLRWSVL